MTRGMVLDGREHATKGRILTITSSQRDRECQRSGGPECRRAPFTGSRQSVAPYEHVRLVIVP